MDKTTPWNPQKFKTNENYQPYGNNIQLATDLDLMFLLHVQVSESYGNTED